MSDRGRSANLLACAIALSVASTQALAESVSNEFFSRAETRISRFDARNTQIELYSFSRAGAEPAPARLKE